MDKTDDFFKKLEEGCLVSYNDPRYHKLIDELIYELIKTKKINLIHDYPFENLLRNIVENGDMKYLYYFAKNVEVPVPTSEKFIPIIESYNEEKNRLRK